MILVTGATGFLGKAIVSALVKQGHQVRILARQSSDTTFFAEYPDVSIFLGDVRDVASLLTALQGCQCVIHAAALFRFWGKQTDFFDTNVTGTQNVLQAAVQVQVPRVIFTSTIAVIGTPPLGAMITEETRPRPVDAYQKSKYQAEQLALQFEQDHDIEVVILRLGALYGPGGRYAFNRLFFEEFLRGWRIQVSGGRHITFPCFIEDAAKGCTQAITLGQSGQIYNISGQSLSHIDLNRKISQAAQKTNWRLNLPKWLMLGTASFLEIIAKLTHREPFYPLNLKLYVFQDWVVDSHKAETDLEFQATPIEDGITQTLAWYRSLGVG
ncbi:MAG: NAD-dependent epimerase/dehydratase family protein [Chloroflexota bacterium]